ncbi:hypothetical protein DFH11DRAFT_1558764 [Phellopilus nigrolimitatus]|nr:hypothetical protein DFH11DRAFT_1558764 [Phellopilus nigrolimitatus]
MSWLSTSSLAVLHALHAIWTCLVALLYHPFVANPQPLEAARPKLPSHIALVLASTKQNPSYAETEAAIRSVVYAARWCKRVGITNLSVYDRQGSVTKCAEKIKRSLSHDIDRVPPDSECSSDASDMEYSPTPPLSDTSDSRPVSPENFCSMPSIVTIRLGADVPAPRRSSLKKRRKKKTWLTYQQQSSQMKLSLISYEASKPFMALLARTFATFGKIASVTGDGEVRRTEITVDKIESAVRDTFHLSLPDLMIVHSLERDHLRCPPVELHGFPPWIMRLTEIYHDEAPSLSGALWNRDNKRAVVALSEETFRRALDGYARAEMRLGR